MVTYFAFFRPAKRRNVGVVELIILSFGLSVVLRYGLQLIFGHEQRYFKVPFQNPIMVLGYGVPPFRVTALAGVLAGAIILYWFIQKTRLGIQIRALAGDEKLAQVSGINPWRSPCSSGSSPGWPAVPPAPSTGSGPPLARCWGGASSSTSSWPSWSAGPRGCGE